MLTVPALTLRFRARYPATSRSVRAVRSDVEDIARDCGVEGECLEDVRLAVSEAARDAVDGRSAEPTYVRVEIELGDGEFVVTICGDQAGETKAQTSVACARAVDQEHDSAVERLETAVAERDRLGGRCDQAVEAENEVAARQAWVHWVDDSDYRGLNAGPFELRAYKQR